jgi:hypothetical protein
MIVPSIDIPNQIRHYRAEEDWRPNLVGHSESPYDTPPLPASIVVAQLDGVECLPGRASGVPGSTTAKIERIEQVYPNERCRRSA